MRFTGDSCGEREMIFVNDVMAMVKGSSRDAENVGALHGH